MGHKGIIEMIILSSYSLKYIQKCSSFAFVADVLWPGRSLVSSQASSTAEEEEDRRFPLCSGPR